MTAIVILTALHYSWTGDPQFPPAMQAKALKATVRIVHPASRGDGSGVVIRYENGFAYILTAAHVVPAMPNGDDIEVSFFPPGKPRADIIPIKTQLKSKSRMPNEDLAVIEIGLKDAPPAVAELCPKDAAPKKLLEEPMPVLATGISPIGAPEAIVDWIRKCIIPKKPDGSKAFHWEADTEQPAGRSGGGLFDVEGRLIGICSGNMNQKAYYVSIFDIHYSLNKNAWGFLTKPLVSSSSEIKAEKNNPNAKKN
jgi:Trypsin-like peptidase domain